MNRLEWNLYKKDGIFQNELCIDENEMDLNAVWSCKKGTDIGQ